jgi:hypothetical protein
LTDENSNVLSIQTLRLMRSTIENSSQYSDDELHASGRVLGSLFPMINEVPGFLNPKEQQSFFTNLISCFIVADMINNGFINPHAAESYLATVQTQVKQASGIGGQQVAEEDDDDMVIVSGNKTPIN